MWAVNMNADGVWKKYDESTCTDDENNNNNDNNTEKKGKHI